MRYVNTAQVVAAQLTTPAENPLLADNNRLMDVWFGGAVVRKQMFKKVTRAEQEAFAENLLQRGFIRSGTLYIDPRSILFAEMEHQMVGGLVTIGYQDNGKPVELKLNGKAFEEMVAGFARKQ
jgi:hypothetical protein